MNNDIILFSFTVLGFSPLDIYGDRTFISKDRTWPDLQRITSYDNNAFITLLLRLIFQCYFESDTDLNDIMIGDTITMSVVQ